MECPPTVLDFCWICGRPMVAPTICTLYPGLYSNSVGADSISARPDVKLLFLLFCQSPCPLFFDCAGAKKSYQKKRQGETRKRELFEKSSLLNSRKNFLATVAGKLSALSGVAPHPLFKRFCGGCGGAFSKAPPTSQYARTSKTVMSGAPLVERNRNSTRSHWTGANVRALRRW